MSSPTTPEDKFGIPVLFSYRKRIDKHTYHEYRIVEWTPNSVWLVKVTGRDGSYTPIAELK